MFTKLIDRNGWNLPALAIAGLVPSDDPKGCFCPIFDTSKAGHVRRQGRGWRSALVVVRPGLDWVVVGVGGFGQSCLRSDCKSCSWEGGMGVGWEEGYQKGIF